MNNSAMINKLCKKLRDSLTYDKWVKKNLTPNCLKCNKNQSLQVHHVIELYYLFSSLWKLYGNWKEVYKHILALHEEDRIEAVTLCSKCHKEIHPLRDEVQENQIRLENWTVFPRNMNFNFAAGTKIKNGITLIPLQVIMGIGHQILNQQFDSKIIQINRRQFAKSLGKTPGTSFNNSLENALKYIITLDIINAYIIENNEIEIHLSAKYIEQLKENPWFFPMNDVKTSSMTELTLKIILNFHSNKTKINFRIETIANKLGFRTQKKSFVIHAIQHACKQITWATVMPRQQLLQFTLVQRGGMPIRTLRKALFTILEGHEN